jgi:putative FmdB family regulatory protein
LPLYDYQCRACSKVTEVRHAFREAYGDPCPACGGEMARVFNPAGIVFKGSGFYINDSRKPAPSESSSTAPAPAASASAPAAAAAPAESSSTKSESSSTKSDSGSKKSESSAA